MKILIKSRQWIERRSLLPFQEGTALISICDEDKEFVKLLFHPSALFRLRFNDVDGDIFYPLFTNEKLSSTQREEVQKKYGVLTDEKAMQIAKFIVGLPPSINTIICQCEHGQSRSAAIAAAIAEHQKKSGVWIFACDQYCPNKLVFRKVLACLKQCGQTVEDEL